jgi:DNA-binding transcriptional MerR regulator
MAADERYSLTELADLAGVTPRTVRYYLGQGLLPAVGPSGPGSKYGATHLARLRLIRRLQAEHLPLAEIRRRLDDLDDGQIRELAASRETARPPDSALEYLRTVLDGPTASAALRAGRPAASQAMTGPMPLAGRSSLAWPAMAPLPPPDTVRGVAETTASDQMEPSPSPLERSQWERIALGPDVELHIRRPLARAQQKQVDRLVTIARELLEEDRS